MFFFTFVCVVPLVVLVVVVFVYHLTLRDVHFHIGFLGKDSLLLPSQP